MNYRFFIAVFCVLAFPLAAMAENGVAGATAPQYMEIPQELLDLAAENENIIIDYYSDTYGAIEPAAGDGADEGAEDDASHEEPLDVPAQ